MSYFPDIQSLYQKCVVELEYMADSDRAGTIELRTDPGLGTYKVFIPDLYSLI
jgi:hypothetical protein